MDIPRLLSCPKIRLGNPGLHPTWPQPDLGHAVAVSDEDNPVSRLFTDDHVLRPQVQRISGPDRRRSGAVIYVGAKLRLWRTPSKEQGLNSVTGVQQTPNFPLRTSGPSAVLFRQG
jgi:hypothetical protein